MQRFASLLGLIALLALACAAPESVRPTGPPPKILAPVRRALPPGTLIELLPAELGTGATIDPIVFDAWWREAVRQSPRFDVAGGVERVSSPIEVAVAFDAAANVVTSTLIEHGRPPLPLASARGPLPAALDELALATRQALGEDVATQPAPVAAIYSPNVDNVRLTEQAAAAATAGDAQRALDLLRQARPYDPGSTITLAALAKQLLTEARPESKAEAVRTAVEALQLTDRLAPTTRHRLLHVYEAAQDRPTEATARELAALAEIALRERPYDPHVQFTAALAHNLLGEYQQSAPMLEALAKRWPDSAEVGYHLTFAELATGHPEAALQTIERVQDRLPPAKVVLPKALALYHSGHTDELARWLQQLSTAPDVSPQAVHELLRMRASLALLTDRADDAAKLLLQDLEWIRQRPSALNSLVLDAVEDGEVLVALGHTTDLRIRLDAFEQLGDLPSIFAQGLVYLGGLIEVAETGKPASAAVEHLEQGGQKVWASQLRAAAHRRRGELMDEMKERVLEYESTEAPLPRAALARVLVAAGDRAHADEVLQALRADLLSFDLQHPRHHPLLSPTAALAYLALDAL